MPTVWFFGLFQLCIELKQQPSNMSQMKSIFVILFLALTPQFIQAQNPAIRQKQFLLTKQKVAIEGYDPTSYFSGKPQKGKPDFTLVYEGVTYQFASATNLQKFKASPASFEPQYGGWCAYAMGKNNEKVEIDPETYKIVGGKLYLFYNKFFTNTLTKWNEEETVLKRQADSNWTKIVQ